MFDRRSFKHGQLIRDAAGKRLGIIDVCGEEKLYVRKSGWSHHFFSVALSQVGGIKDGDVILKPGEDRLEALGPSGVTEKMVMMVKPIHEATFLAGTR